MYNKITILSGNVNELCKYLDMNGYNYNHYNYPDIDEFLYVLEDETDWIITILKERNYTFLINDEYPESQYGYYWRASSNDGSYLEESRLLFSTKREAYEDMRNAALDKMKWNTEYDEDFEDGIPIDYTVMFSQDKIIHESFSGKYIYEIVELTK